MPLNFKVIAAVEQLNYRVTVGDVAVQSGLDLHLAQQELVSLASSAGGHLQVTEAGEVAYLFSRNFRSVLQAKFLQLRLLLWWQKIWKVLFYLIRISFGILLIASIGIIAIAILLIIFATFFSDKDSSDSVSSSDGDGFGEFPTGWLFSDWFYFFSPNPYSRAQTTYPSPQKSSMNFLEGVFSFLFGDGNPNQNLDEHRWQAVGKSIRHNQEAVIAEQIIPFLDKYDKGLSADDAMLPILLRFDGQPEVSPEGEIIYHFPELQTSIKSDPSVPDSPYLKESFWEFSQASSGQILGAIGLGGINFIGAIILGELLVGKSFIGFLGFVQFLYPVLLIYGLGFLAIPLGRYFWIKWQNQSISARNQNRKLLAEGLSHLTPLQEHKLDYARQFCRLTQVDEQQLVYTTEKDLLEQEADNQAAIDIEWGKRLDI